MTKTTKGKQCPKRTIDPDALARAIAAARKLKEADPERYKSIPIEQGKQ